ncbi:hypothetical protein DEU56DRAFT_41062 [Suillus clintonianus]|uniref:uncharacterized protein n=1 Tax=Suillus clintonianus TaxID=1904413 RepID=UPI001B88411E|nr:uncharacterized protein DEU56DRAFT_41062 [Suillus clintonianus]KAG2124059.1 hypothetical protein DEU56DRAFT_41062 [Suillus clintonianus]
MVVCMDELHTLHPDMTYTISNNPDFWPLISAPRLTSYFSVACAVVVVYDWVFSFAQEFELIWMQRWSFMTALYICVRNIGILYSFNFILWLLSVPITNVVGNIFYFTMIWVPVVVNAMLGVIMMTRIHAMYGRSNKILIFLALLLLVSTIATGVMAVIGNLGYSGGETVLSGYHICGYNLDTDAVDLNDDMIIPTAIWEVLAFVLSVWIVTKHLHELRQSQRGSTIGDCFTVLIRSHMRYFLAFAVVACLTLGGLSQNFMHSSSLGAAVYAGVANIAQVFQMCLLGPRLILGVREYNTKVVSRSDGGSHMTSIVFQAGGDALTSEYV